MNDASLNVNFNIKIKIVDSKGKTLQEKHIHNKATRNMVNSIIQFLQGSFNPSEFNDPYEKYSNPEQAIINNAYGAKRYLPSCTGVGDIGVGIQTSGDDKIISINQDLFAKTSFYDTELQQEIDVPRIKFRRVRPVRGYDLNNSEGIVFTTVLPKGYLVYVYEDGEVKHDEQGNPVYRENYFDYYGEEGTDATSVRANAITEIGLFSNTNKDNGLLLARVLLDGKLADGELGQRGVMADPDYEYNPLIQTENTSVVIEWKIGIISIGTNDEFIVESESGDPDPSGDEYEGPYTSKSLFGSSSSSDRVYPTADLVMTQNFTVEHIPYARISNSSGGDTVSIN